MNSRKRVKKYRLTNKGRRAAMFIGAAALVILLGGVVIAFALSNNFITEEYRVVDETNKLADHKHVSEIDKKDDKIYAIHYPQFESVVLSDEVDKVIALARTLDEDEVVSFLDYESVEAFDQFISVNFTLKQYKQIEDKIPVEETATVETYRFIYDEKTQKFLKLEDCLRPKAIRVLKENHAVESLYLKEITESGIVIGTSHADVTFKYQDHPDYFKLVHEEIPTILEYPVITTIKRELNEKPRLAFTFDDGPTPGITDRIVDLFDQYGGKATFFALGSRMVYYPEMVRYAAERGHEVGSHSYTHPDLWLMSWEEVNDELVRTEDVFYSITGKEIELFRATYGNTSQAMRDNIEVPIIFWTIDSMDWSSRNADAVIDEVIPYLHDDAIILMHDLYESTADAVEMILPQLAEQYQFVTVSELLEAKANESGTQE